MDVKDLKDKIVLEIEKAFEKAFSKNPGNIKLGFPPDVKLGDFAVEFFGEAKNLKMSPAEIAKKVGENFDASDLIEKIESVGPYLNIKIKNEKLFGAVISEIELEKNKFGDNRIGQGKKVMVEYLSPNTNKPLHLGHVRNGAIGVALANILEANGYDTIKAIAINDRGIHICKSILAWQKWGNGETPQSTGMKGDHFVGKYYVKFAQELEKNLELEKEAQEMLQKWEAGDEEILKTWKLMNGWVYAGFEKTYEDYGFKFDEIFYESETYKLGKDIIFKGLKKNIFRIDETGATVFDLPEKEFGRDKDGKLKKQIVLRADGTSVYMTQDLGTAVARFEKYKLEKLIYVVGDEQVFHFKVLFKILESLGYAWAVNLRHFAEGMVNLPEGKMKSREGKVVDADELLEKVEKIIKENIVKREKNFEEDSGSGRETLNRQNSRARKIALGAIKFHLLRVKPSQKIEFNPKESVAIDGFTGPYCQYAYARIAGILRNLPSHQKNNNAIKANKNNKFNKKISFFEKKDDFWCGGVDYNLLGNNKEELELIQKVIQFPEAVAKAGEELNPLRIITSVHEIAQAFNLFYSQHQVLDPENEKVTLARLKLVEAVGIIIKTGLNLLGIEVLERM